MKTSELVAYHPYDERRNVSHDGLKSAALWFLDQYLHYEGVHFNSRRILGLFSGHAPIESAIARGESQSIQVSPETQVTLVDYCYANNFKLNSEWPNRIRPKLIRENVFDFVQECREQYDLVILSAVEYRFRNLETNCFFLDHLTKIIKQGGLVVSINGIRSDSEIDEDIWEVINKNDDMGPALYLRRK